MSESSPSRVMSAAVLAALLFALAACDRTTPPLAAKALTPAVLLPPDATPIGAPAVPTAPTIIRTLTPAAGTLRSTPASVATGTARPSPAASNTPTPTATRTPFVTPSQTFRYVVQLDDTLSGIAARFKTTVEALILLNNLPGDLIIAGQQLVIPGSPPTATSTPRPPAATATKRPTPRTYVVRTGDTLSAIARRYGTTAAILMRYNGLRSEVVVPGQIIRIP